MRRASSPSRGGLRLWVGLALAAGLVGLLAVAADLVGLLAVGAVLGYLLLPVVDGLERRGLSRTAAAALVLAVVLGVVVLAGVLAVPAVTEQAMALRARWQSGDLLRLVTEAEAALAARLPGVDAADLGLRSAVERALAPDDTPLIAYVPSAFEAVGNAVLVPFVLFGVLRDGPDVRRRLLATVPNRYFEFTMNVAFKADAHLGGYLRSQATISVLVGAATALGLAIAGVDSYLVLGLVTGLANVVPYVGFAVSAGLAVVVSILTSGAMDEVVWVLVVFGVVQGLENVVFQPWITGRTVSMPAVLVLLAILVGGRVGGVVGMALAVPVAAVLKVLVVETVIHLRRYHL